MSDLNILLDGLIEDAWYEGLASDGSKLAKYMAAQNDPQSIRQKIVDEFDALNQRIAELTEHIDKIEHGAIFLGHPKEYWLSLNRYAYDGGYEKLIQDNAYHVCANEIAVKLIAELEEQLRWRPVSELPVPNNLYEVKCEGTNNGLFHAYGMYWDDNTWTEYLRGGLLYDIIEWRPIPELEVKGE